MQNLNLLFNKLYYQKLGSADFEASLIDCNKKLLNATFNHAEDYKASIIVSQENYKAFLLQTVYPGLLIGSGNPHGTSLSDEDIKIGFAFDYVTGQPCIPGSSVKGVLRSHFEDRGEAVRAILGKEDIDVDALAKEIFGVARGEDEPESDGQDIFLDAVVYDGDSKGRLLGDDYITPHPSPTKNPKPIRFIKVLPDVRFEFRFILKDGTITKEEKEKLFKELLLLFGIGAKTNVGYGILKECDGIIALKAPQKEDAKPAVHRASADFTKKANAEDCRGAKCKACGQWNWRFKQGTTVEHDSWKKNKCCKCREDLR